MYSNGQIFLITVNISTILKYLTGNEHILMMSWIKNWTGSHNSLNILKKIL